MNQYIYYKNIFSLGGSVTHYYHFFMGFLIPFLLDIKNDNNDSDTATASNPSMLYSNVKPKHLKTRNKYTIKTQKEVNIYNKRGKNVFS